MPIYALDEFEPQIDELAYVHPDAVVIGRVTLGPEASVWPGAVLRGDHGTISVGARTSVQDGTVVHCTAEHPTVIGADCVVGHNTHLEGCVVEDGCLIGSGSTTLNRAVIGAGSIVAAGALVPVDVPRDWLRFHAAQSAEPPQPAPQVNAEFGTQSGHSRQIDVAPETTKPRRSAVSECPRQESNLEPSD